MRVIVAGSRSITDEPLIAYVMGLGMGTLGLATEVVTGCAPGVDAVAAKIAREYREPFPVKEFPAAWGDINVEGAVVRTRTNGSKYNVLAGHQRNQKMAEYADALIAIWDGKSTGTKDMISRMERLSKPYFIYSVATKTHAVYNNK